MQNYNFCIKLEKMDLAVNEAPRGQKKKEGSEATNVENSKL